MFGLRVYSGVKVLWLVVLLFWWRKLVMSMVGVLLVLFELVRMKKMIWFGSRGMFWMVWVMLVILELLKVRVVS